MRSGGAALCLVSLVVLALTSVGCALAPNIHVLWFFRALQGIASGAGFVVGRAIVRDLYEGHQAQRVLAQVTVIFTIAPAIAPVLGGWLQEWFGWRSNFYFLALFAVAMCAWSFLSLPETLHPERRQPLNPAFLLRSYVRTLTHRRFLAAAFAASLNFTAIFLYISSAPVFLMQHLHLRETQFFWLFGPVTAGMMIGALTAGKLAGRITSVQTLAIGYGAMVGAALVNVGFHALQTAALPWSVAPLFLYSAGMAFSLPTLVLFGLDIFPDQKGLAASCQAFLMTSINALTAGVLSPLANASPLRLALTSATLTALGLAGTLLYFKRDSAPRAQTAVASAA
jgi:DHA1 family bicyclomycin/chloramphenicol resistance-like MFS transporter